MKTLIYFIACWSLMTLPPAVAYLTQSLIMSFGLFAVFAAIGAATKGE